MQDVFKKGCCYTRDEIHRECGGSIQSYLPTVKGMVVVACFKKSKEMNPQAPDVILSGTGPIIEKTAKQLASQKSAVPTFLKKEVNKWEYF